MISQATIETVFETARVEEVIGDFVQLKRAGSNLKGLSPFVNEKSPSFMVSPVKQIWKDFSSGKGGNAVTFLMEHEHFTYPEAIRYLAKKYNIEIEETEQTNEEAALANEKESMYLVSEFASKYFQNTLHNTEAGKAIGLSYFKERGFTTDTIKKFGLGYSPDEWDAFTKEALGKGYKLEFLDKTGLTIVKEEKQFDRFKGRVMFPIQSMSGRVLGFGGRILTNDKKAAKYLNSPESDIYHKSKILYGIYHAKQAIAKQNNCYLVEGYTDVIQFHQAGIENVVASSGTALTVEQINLVKRLTPNMTVLFDGDAAGLRASIRGIDLILEAGMNVKVCTFPDGDDPDSFAKKTPYDELIKYLDENAKDFIQFKASLLMNEAQNDPIKKAELIRDMVVSISKISDRIKREVYLQECSRIMDISEDVLYNTLAQIDKKDFQETNKKFKKEQKELEVVRNENVAQLLTSEEVANLLERKIIEILILYGNKEIEFEETYLRLNEDGKEENFTEKRVQKIFEKVYMNLQEDEIEFSNPIFKKLIHQILAIFLSKGNFERNEFLNQLEPELEQIVIDILMNEEKYELHGWLDKKQVFVKTKDDEAVLKRLILETLVSYREYLIQNLSKKLLEEISKETTEVSLQQAMQNINDYNTLKATISNSIGRIRTDFFK
ncbi:DNA primase [Flavobacterium sp.]|uniref:DNA primase n=1 Tax=Flavobacterium sp. TaxID=239 RepID=UPI003527C74D